MRDGCLFCAKHFEGPGREGNLHESVKMVRRPTHPLRRHAERLNSFSSVCVRQLPTETGRPESVRQSRSQPRTGFLSTREAPRGRTRSTARDTDRLFVSRRVQTARSFFIRAACSPSGPAIQRVHTESESSRVGVYSVTKVAIPLLGTHVSTPRSTDVGSCRRGQDASFAHVISLPPRGDLVRHFIRRT